MKTIKLKVTHTGNVIEMNPLFIESMEWIDRPQETPGTELVMFSGKIHRVIESPELIKDLAKKLDTYFTTSKLFENEQVYNTKGE